MNAFVGQYLRAENEELRAEVERLQRAFDEAADLARFLVSDDYDWVENWMEARAMAARYLALSKQPTNVAGGAGSPVVPIDSPPAASLNGEQP